MTNRTEVHAAEVNGHEHTAPATSGPFNDRDLRKLSRLYYAAQGAQVAAQAAAQTANEHAARFREALAEACEGLDVQMPPPGAQVDTRIDWKSGEFEFVPMQQRG